ncbi:MAG: hypothetical protein ACKVQK_13375 [Burkholderiales bacterium]
MEKHKTRRIALLVSVVVLLAVACATQLSTSEPQREPLARIELGVGHFNRDGKAFHYWDKEKEIPGVCARCHSAVGVPEYLRTGKTAPAPHVKNGYACTNCHADMLTYDRHKVDKVTFASGLTVDSGNNNSNLCMTCHQGRESTVSLNKAISGQPLDTVNPKLNFVHVHYFPAGATVFGTQAKVGYEYTGKTYAGRFGHVEGMNACTNCHDPHSGEVHVAKCGTCHDGVKTLADTRRIRMSSVADWDGNGRVEGIPREIDNMKLDLYAAIQQYARSVGGSAIAFTSDGFPYWHTDLNGNGRVDAEEFRPNNNYKAYTPRLSQAIYNYSFALRDPGAAYHNGVYVAQLLYDSLESLAASGKVEIDMKNKTRPTR